MTHVTRRLSSAIIATALGLGLVAAPAQMALAATAPSAPSAPNSPSPTTSDGPTDPTPEPTPEPTKKPNKPDHKTFDEIKRGKAVLRNGDTGPVVDWVQERLNWVGIPTERTGRYGSATQNRVRHFQDKFFITPSGNFGSLTYGKLRQISRSGPDVDRRCRSGKVVCIDKTQKVVRLMFNGKEKIVLDARFGDPVEFPTREGTFRVYSKSVHVISTLYHTPMPYSMFFSGGQAVHYSRYFAADGYYGASHGCVNIRDWRGVKELYSRVPIGTKVVVYRS